MQTRQKQWRWLCNTTWFVTWQQSLSKSTESRSAKRYRVDWVWVYHTTLARSITEHRWFTSSDVSLFLLGKVCDELAEMQTSASAVAGWFSLAPSSASSGLAAILGDLGRLVTRNIHWNWREVAEKSTMVNTKIWEMASCTTVWGVTWSKQTALRRSLKGKSSCWWVLPCEVPFTWANRGFLDKCTWRRLSIPKGNQVQPAGRSNTKYCN